MPTKTKQNLDSEQTVSDLIEDLSQEAISKQQPTSIQPTMLTIHQAMAAILADVDAVSKHRDADMGKGGQYKFRGIDDMYNALHKSFAKYKVFIIPEVINNQFETQDKGKDSYGNMKYQYSCILTVKFTFVSEDGSSISATGIGHALDTSDKATNKAQSSALKYCLMQTLLIPTEESKDVETANNQVAPPAPIYVTANQYALLIKTLKTEGVDLARAMINEYQSQKISLKPEQIAELANIKAELDAQKELEQEALIPTKPPVEVASMRPFTDVECEGLLAVFASNGLDALKTELVIVQAKYTLSDQQKQSLETITTAKLF